jgi:peptidoglycan hydrolase-like protein with peptidoglycan-binding domain
MVDGQNAARLAEKYGAPAGTSIFFAVDFAAQQSDAANIQAYFTAYKAACAPYVARMYADGLVSEAVEPGGGWYIPAATGWPGYAAAIAAGKAAIVQEPPASFFGLDADPCTVYDESVLWQPAGTDPVVVQPAPDANPMPDLKTMQSYLGVTADGIYGPHTAAAVEKYYGG